MAQERCIRKCVSQGRLWTLGEVRTAGVNAETGKPEAHVHFRLVEEDEAVDERDVYSDEKVKEARRESGMRDKRAAITKALYALDPDDDAHWTRNGDPAVQAVYVNVDFEVSRNEISAALPGFDRETAKGLQRS